MAATDGELYDLLDVLYRLGARCAGQAVLVQLAKEHLPHSDTDFWILVDEALARDLIEQRRGGYVTLTLQGDRMLNGPRPDDAPVSKGGDLLTDSAALANRLSALSDPEFDAVEKAVDAERQNRT